MKNEALYKSFENIPSRKGRGGVYPYIRWQDVADRMNEVFGTNWSSEVMSQDIIGANVIIRVKISIFNDENKVIFTQEGFGGAPNDASNEAGNPFKAAYSKALKDACKKWGVGLYLDDDDDSVSTPSLPAGYMGKEIGVPPTAPSAPPMKENTEYIKTPSPIPSVANNDTPLPPGVGGGMPLPPGIAMGNSNTVVDVPKQSMTPTSPSMPSAPPMSKVDTINTGEPEYISDVQRAALQSILSIKGVDYKSLAQEAFEFNGLIISPIPEADKLSYQEAVYVIKFGNDKFRKR
jgi:hypothetical protein